MNTVSRIISDDVLSCIIQIESGGDPRARARTSTALGLGQFIAATWLAVVKRHRPDLLQGRSREQVLALRTDPALAIELLARFTEDNARALGEGFSPGDLYLAHFSGIAAVRRLLRASAATPVAALMSANAIAANARILKGKTAGEVRAWASRKMQRAQGRNWIAKLYPATAASSPGPLASRLKLPAAPASASSRESRKPASAVILVAALIALVALAASGLN